MKDKKIKKKLIIYDDDDILYLNKKFILHFLNIKLTIF